MPKVLPPIFFVNLFLRGGDTSPNPPETRHLAARERKKNVRSFHACHVSPCRIRLRPSHRQGKDPVDRSGDSETAGQDVSGFRRLRLVFFAACFEATDAPVAAGLTAGGGLSPPPCEQPCPCTAARPNGRRHVRFPSVSATDARGPRPARRQWPAMRPQTDVASFSLKNAIVRPQASSAASLL